MTELERLLSMGPFEVKRLNEAGRVGGNMASGEQQAKAYASPISKILDRSINYWLGNRKNQLDFEPLKEFAQQEIEAWHKAGVIQELDKLGRKYEQVMYLKDNGIGTAIPSSLFYERISELKGKNGNN